MPSPTPQQKFTIGVYVVLLTLVIIVIWGFFIKKEFGPALTSKSSDSSFSDIKDNFNKYVDQGLENFETLKENLESLNSSESEVPPELAQAFVKKTQDELHQKRTADWLVWQSDNLNFKYPGNWFVEPKFQPIGEIKQIILTSYNQNEQLLPDTRASIKISFNNNSDKLTAFQWWQFQSLAFKATSTITVAGQPGLKIINDSDQLIYVPFNDQMIEVLAVTVGDNQEELLQKVDDFVEAMSLVN